MGRERKIVSLVFLIALFILTTILSPTGLANDLQPGVPVVPDPSEISRPPISPPPDTTPPTVFLFISPLYLEPFDKPPISGAVTLVVQATDLFEVGGFGISKVEFYGKFPGKYYIALEGFYGESLGTDTTYPYSISYDTTQNQDGLTEFTAVAYDTAGNRGVDTIFETVDNTPPEVVSTSPGGGEENVPSNANITATLSEPVALNTINNSTFFLKEKGGAENIPAVVSYDRTTKTAILDPSGNLDYSKTYVATLTTAVKDLAGNSLASEKVWTFETKWPLSFSDPKNGNKLYINPQTKKFKFYAASTGKKYYGLDLNMRVSEDQLFIRYPSLRNFNTNSGIRFRQIANNFSLIAYANLKKDLAYASLIDRSTRPSKTYLLFDPPGHEL